MRRFLRKLFSPTFLIIFILLIELIVLIGLYFVFDAYFSDSDDIWGALIYLGFRLLVFILEAVLLFRIISKHENPEFKVPWIIFLVILPVTTFIVYMVFANHGLRRKDRKIIKPTNEILENKFHLEKEDIEDFQKNVPLEYRSLFKYLRKVTKLHTTSGNEIKYYKNGEAFFPDFVESLKKAEHFIFMEFFIITEGKWWSEIEKILLEKASKGVEIRLIYDDMGSFGGLPNNYPHKMRKKGIKCYKFHPFRPILSGIYNNRTHRKIAVIDHKEAYTGGMNLADEYANDLKRFGYWKDTMVKIKGPGISNLIATFLQNYDLSTYKVSDYDKYLVDDYERYNDPGYIYFFGDGPGSYSNNEPIGEENYLQIIGSAKRTLYISTPYLIPTFRLNEALKAAAKRGVDVKLFVPGVPDKKTVYLMAKGEFKQLTEGGVHVYVYTPGFNHEKQIVADDNLAFCGTINFDFRSLTHHFECGVTMYNVPCIKEMIEDFKEMECQSQLIDSSFKLSAGKRLKVAILKLFRTLL